MSAKHTPEPWRVAEVEPARYPAYPIKSGGGLIATVPIRAQGYSRADAERIAACVNACAGIEDPAALRAQRDELLTALTRCLNFIEHDHANRGKCTNAAEWARNVDLFRSEGPSRIGIGRSYTDEASVDLVTVRAAIAKAEGRS